MGFNTININRNIIKYNGGIYKMQKEARRLEFFNKISKLEEEYSDIIDAIDININWKNDKIPQNMLESVQNNTRKGNK